MGERDRRGTKVDTDPLAVLRQLARGIAAPFAEFDEVSLQALNDEARADYVMAVVPAVSSAINHHYSVEARRIIDRQHDKLMRLHGKSNFEAEILEQLASPEEEES